MQNNRSISVEYANEITCVKEEFGMFPEAEVHLLKDFRNRPTRDALLEF
jgi:hypothetical protein